MRIFLHAVYTLVFCSWLASASAEPVLVIDHGGRRVEFDKAALLAHPAARDIDVPNDMEYRRPMRYRAVALSDLLSAAGFKPGDQVRFAALDGYSVNMPAALLLGGPGAAEAWLAVEPDDAPWPPLRKTPALTAGPVYLVWLNPERSGVTGHQWTYQIARIDSVAPIEARYPMIVPAATLPAGSPVRRGFAVFKQHCMACHTINGGGDGKVGPDLNLPANPTAYFQPGYLRGLIRDPKSVRSWPTSLMPASAPDMLSDADLDALIAYLLHMDQERRLH